MGSRGLEHTHSTLCSTLGSLTILKLEHLHALVLLYPQHTRAKGLHRVGVLNEG